MHVTWSKQRLPVVAMPALVLLVALALLAPRPVTAADAAPDRFRVDLSFGEHLERLQSHLADSLGLGVTRGLEAQVASDFEVLEFPMKSALRPGLHVTNRVRVSDQVFAPQTVAGSAATIPAVTHAPTLEVTMGAGLGLPLALVDGDPGALMFVRYEGGVILSSDSGYGVLTESHVGLGFERRIGVFDGSLTEIQYGSNQRFGPAASSGRWNMRFRLMSRVSGLRAAAAPATPAKGAPPVVDTGRPLRIYLEMNVDTDGHDGPDLLSGTLGAAMDLGTLMHGVGTLLGL
ncbi:MAG TPA: hypothetical protein VLV15_17560 [Dongiaceae bacterium]|nr:hypothetical protein [Dongiaceae bacterium]